MKKGFRKAAALIMIAVLLFTAGGCKTVDEKNRGLSEPTATPTPVVTVEDLIEKQAETVNDYYEQMKTVFKDQTADLPDTNSICDIDMKGSFSIKGFMNVDYNIKGNADIRISSNIAHIMIDLTKEGNFNSDPISGENKIEFYIDNSEKNGSMKIYQKEDDNEWTVSEQNISEMFNSAESDAQPETQNSTEYFKDFKKFLKEHTEMEQELGVFRNNTTFTLQEFREYFNTDIDTMMNDISAATETMPSVGDNSAYAGQVASILSSVFASVRECLNGMTGDVKFVQEFDSEIQPTSFSMNVKNMKMASHGNFEVTIDFDDLDLKITKRTDNEAVTIPDHVKNGAVK